MLARLYMELSANELSYRNSSLLQGILFEHISPEYAEELHRQTMHPYSLYLLKNGDDVSWVIQTLNKEAYDEIIEPLMKSEFDGFHLKKLDTDVKVMSKKLEAVDKKILLQEFNEKESEGDQQLHFISATAFKQSGRIHILPDIRLIFQNIMNRYSACSDRVDMWDEDTLNQLVDSAYIFRHNIRSTSFPCEGVTIPGYIGDVTIRTKGTETLKRYVRFLLHFAEYSGIGIKTGMGMGAVRRADKNER